VASIIDPISVAFVEFGRRAEPPNRELHKSREAGREVGVALAGVNPPGQLSDNVGAAAWGVTAQSVGALGPEPSQGAGAVRGPRSVRRDSAEAALTG
jgi:hypothetical protein